jgi:curved DNA-binding protein CbpA
VTAEQDPYEILQVRPDAGDDVIRAAYRALARRFHPDISADAGSVPMMVSLNWAWEVLGDPERRSRHDRERRSGRQSAGPVQGTWPGTAGSDAGSRADPGGTGSPAGGPTISRRTADGRVIEWRTAPDGTGGAGPPPGRPSGSILPFGRFIAWSIGEIVRYDPGYLDWLDQRREGLPYHDEIEVALTRLGWRSPPASGGGSSRRAR